MVKHVAQRGGVSDADRLDSGERNRPTVMRTALRPTPEEEIRSARKPQHRRTAFPALVCLPTSHTHHSASSVAY